MATSFDRWEKDPFFSAAEEVQESADRMESVYRRWIHERKACSRAGGGAGGPSVELRRELHTALGTAKWQLEELEREVTLNDEANSVGEATRARHGQFVTAIADQISLVENSLKVSILEEGETPMTWVQLDEGERDELALFLSCSLADEEKVVAVSPVFDLKAGNNPPLINGEKSMNCSKNPCHSNESSSCDTKERAHGHQRAACASTTADTAVLKILVSSEETSGRSLSEQPDLPPPRILRFSGLTSAVEAVAKTRWYRNGFRKWKGGHQHDATELIPLRNHQLSRGIDECYERGKSCLSSCADESCDKPLDSWAGAFHRQLQRSQYQIQYGRPIQMVIWAILASLLIVLLLYAS